jgi:hypothetical protein
VFALELIDELSIFFFTLEYSVRFICSPRKWIFFKDPMNLVDLFAILPFYLTLVSLRKLFRVKNVKNFLYFSLSRRSTAWKICKSSAKPVNSFDSSECSGSYDNKLQQ